MYFPVVLSVLVASAVTSATMLTQNAAIQQVTNYSTGYIRREYSEVKEEGILFVQAEVHAIGVCFASVDASPSAEPTAEPTALPTAFATAAASLPASLLPLSLPSAAPSITPTSASGNDPIVYRQLLSASIDSTRQVVNLFYTEFAEPSCTTPLRSFTTQLPAQESIETVNNVELAVDTQYVLDFEAATAMPAAVPGFAFR